MDHRTVTLEAGYARRNHRPSPKNRNDPMKFTYASGARPLEGFTIRHGVGVGGFGEVYFAVSDAGKEVALKRIQRNLEVELRGVRQCLNLKHPNLLSLYDIRSDDGEAWVVMEPVRGESLRDVLKRHPTRRDASTTVAWFAQIASGVDYLHQQGIVHRDLKPANIFADEGVIKVGDYGLSKLISASRHSGHTESVGTFHYMAPEIGRGSYGREVDIYALGIILYEMLTGRLPFDGETSQEIIMKHLTAMPDLSIVPERYRAVIANALQKDPQKRFQSAGQMVAAIHAAVESVDQIVVGTLVPPNRFSQPPVVENTGSAPHSPQARSVEPVTEAVLVGVRRSREWWNELQLPTAAKVVLIVVIAILAVANAGWIIPALMVLGLVYVAYFAFHSAMQLVFNPHPNLPRNATPHAEASTPGPATVASPPTGVWMSSKLKRQYQVDFLRQSLAVRSPRTRLTELIGSMLEATVIAAVLSLVALIVGGTAMDDSVFTWTVYAWMSTTTTLGAWFVLATSAAWASKSGDEIRRRFGMLVVGLMLGLLAWACYQFLLLDSSSEAPRIFTASRWSLHADQPPLRAFLLYFGLQFSVLRWWKQADPLRTARLGLGHVVGCVVLAVATDLIWPGFAPWGMLISATISVAVQLTSPWMSPQKREAICRLT